METTKYNPMQTVKREFFAMRNGVIADTYRKAGSTFRIVFGLNLPQLVEIAGRTPHDRELAEALWANTTTRESMLLAPMLINPADFTEDDARRWLTSVCSYEVADILCHRLLRKTSYAWSLAESLMENPVNEYDQYVALRLAFNLVATDPRRALAIARRMPGDRVAEMLAEEARFQLGEE